MEWPQEIVEMALKSARDADPQRKTYRVPEHEHPVCSVSTILADEVVRLRELVKRHPSA